MLVLANVKKLYDGTSSLRRAIHEHVDVWIQGGRVHAVRPHDPTALSEETGNRRGVHHVDCSDYTVTPGLIDCHGHVTVLGLSKADMERMNAPVGLLYIERILHATLVNGGVTTMRDVGGATHQIKDLIARGILIGPRLKIAICMLSTTGGHADFRGPDRCHAQLSTLWPPAPGRPSSIVDGPWECRKRVREVAACGADLIKICASPGIASPSDHLGHRDLSPEEVEAVCEEATARGLRVAAHAHSQNGIELAIRSGVNDIQHASFLKRRHVDLAYERSCTITPTSWVISELQNAEGLSDFVREKAKLVVDSHAKAVQYAASGDIPVLMGTDPVLPGMHGRNYMELVYLIKDGLSPLAAWYGGTGLAARHIGQEDAGTLEPGQRADLLIAKGDIIEKPELLDNGALLEVLQDGRGHRGLSGVPQRSFESTVRRVLEEA